MRIKLLVGTVVLVGAASYLAFAGMQSGWVYYLDVDTYLSAPKYQEQRVRLCGRVSEENLNIQAGDLTASFVLVGPTKTVPVVFRGVIPDTFKASCDVVLEGRCDDAGVFQADVLMTKCASKYQAEEHAKRLEPGR
jgi:cytochrome c-type biogenesis protein CcmE